jgi:hypothetical protein
MKNEMSNAIKTNHPASDFIREDYLKPESVSVMMRRIKSGVYGVEILHADRDYTFESDVAAAVAKAIGGREWTHFCGSSITVSAPAGFRAPKGFVRIDNL